MALTACGVYPDEIGAVTQKKERETSLQRSPPRRGGPNGAHSNTSDPPEFTRPSGIAPPRNPGLGPIARNYGAAATPPGAAGKALGIR